MSSSTWPAPPRCRPCTLLPPRDSRCTTEKPACSDEPATTNSSWSTTSCTLCSTICSVDTHSSTDSACTALAPVSGGGGHHVVPVRDVDEIGNPPSNDTKEWATVTSIPVVSLDDPDIICFSVTDFNHITDYNNFNYKVWIIKLNIRSKTLMFVVEYATEPWRAYYHLPARLRC